MRPVDAVASALGSLGRRQSYQALSREIAWTATRSTESSQHDLELLVPLVERQLCERLDQLPSVVQRAAARTEADQLGARPHDRDGADMLADVAAHDAAIEYLSAVYMDLLDWAVGILQDRRAVEAGRVRRWRRLFSRAVADGPVQCDVPQRIVDGLSRRSEQPGWPDRRAA